MRCPVCDVVLASGPCPNFWCHRDDRGFDVAWTIGVMEGGLRRAIVGWKYRGQRRRVPGLALLLADYLRGASWFDDVDLVVAGPGEHTRTIVLQAASKVGHLWPVDATMVGMRGPVLRLATSPSLEVRRLWAACSLRPALTVRGPVSGRVLVVDDVFTEGSTLREVALALRAAGASAVSGLALARAQLHRGSG